MSVGRFVKLGFVVAATICGASTFAFAADQADVQSVPAAQPTYQLASNEFAPSTTDGLHSDKRWPKFANCVNNTGSQDEFVSCLRSAFLADGTGTELALLQR